MSFLLFVLVSKVYLYVFNINNINDLHGRHYIQHLHNVLSTLHKYIAVYTKNIVKICYNIIKPDIMVIYDRNIKQHTNIDLIVISQIIITTH